jgi:alkylation response protein AidB-like acyl-CoA dehydrogenase
MATAAGAQLLEAVERIRPVIEANREWSEKERRLSPPVFDAMRDAGLFRMALPKGVGGFELHPVETYRVIEALARIDSAAGWAAGISQAWGSVGLRSFPAGAIEDAVAKGDVIAAGAFLPPGTLTRVPGGFRFTGGGPFASGAHHATYHLLSAIEVENGEPILNPATGQPDMRVVMLPRADTTIHDTWNTFGMRGTGSHDISADDVFVPENRVGSMGQVLSPAFSAPQYQIFNIAILFETISSLGVAQAAIDYLRDLAQTKVPALNTQSLAHRSSAQWQVAKAKSLVDASRSYIDAATTTAIEEVATTGQLSMDRKVDLQLAASFAAEACADAVDLVWDAAGTTGIRLDSPLERYFRDIHTLAQHASKSLPRFESSGQILFGVESDWGLFYL